MEGSLFTALDANLNRAKEALRVLEDLHRFVAPHALWARRLRKLRHEVDQPLELYRLRLLAARRVEHDPGRDHPPFSTLASRRSTSFPLLPLLFPNLKRLQEALRSLEEFSKRLPSKAISERYQELRFKVYTIEQEMVKDHQQPFQTLHRPGLLYVIVGALGSSAPADARTSFSGITLERLVCDLIRGGADIIQLREKGLSDQTFLSLARRVRKVIAPPAIFLVNDRADLAVLCQADGVHLGERDLSVKEARQILGPLKIIGQSAHSVRAALHAQGEGADYVAVGTIFLSPTKPELPAKGLSLLRQVRSCHLSIPWFAIGGITEERLGSVVRSGCERVVVSSALLRQKNIVQATRRFKKQLRMIYPSDFKMRRFKN